jgi:transposase
MASRIAGIDVHKQMLAVVIVDMEAEQAQPLRLRFGTTVDELARLRRKLLDLGVRGVVMESTAQYWRTVWWELEADFRLHLAQAQSNRARRGRKGDFVDAERLVRRFVSGELILSFVPDAEQREWRMLTRTKVQLVRDRVRLLNEIECLLEQARIKLAAVVSDLLGLSSRRMLRALAQGVSDPDELVKLAHYRLQVEREQLRAALRGQLSDCGRELLGLYLDHVEFIDRQLEQLDQRTSATMGGCADAVRRLAETPGLGPNSAQQIIAEVGETAATFDSAAELASWAGVCPGSQQSAGRNYSGRSAKGNRYLRRILNQAAQAAARTKGSYFEGVLRRLLPRLGYGKAIWAIAHRLCRLIWKILHEGARYVEYGERGSPQTQRRRLQRMLRDLRKAGYTVLPPTPPLSDSGIPA